MSWSVGTSNCTSSGVEPRKIHLLPLNASTFYRFISRKFGSQGKTFDSLGFIEFTWVLGFVSARRHEGLSGLRKCRHGLCEHNHQHSPHLPAILIWR